VVDVHLGGGIESSAVVLADPEPADGPATIVLPHGRTVAGQDDLTGVAVGSLLGPVREPGPGVAVHGALPGDGERAELRPCVVRVRRLWQPVGAYGGEVGLRGGSGYGGGEDDDGAEGRSGGPAPDS
jgi:hypothetical protein